MPHCTFVSNETQALRLIRSTMGKPYCPRCFRRKPISLLPEGRYHCRRCRYKFSLKTLLGFKGSRLSLNQVLTLLNCFSLKYPLKTALDLARASYPTARLAYQRLRLKLPSLKEKLRGDIIVDECFVGKQKTYNQVMVAGVVNREFTQAKLKPVPDREQDTLEQFLLDHVAIPSLISSDGHASYLDIEWYGYGHNIDNHAHGQLKKTCPIERLWALFKTHLRRTYHHIWKESIQNYAHEFEARFNYRQIVNNPLNLLTYLLTPVPTA